MKKLKLFQREAIHPWWTMRLSLFFFMISIMATSALITFLIYAIGYQLFPVLFQNRGLSLFFFGILFSFFFGMILAAIFSKSWLKTTQDLQDALEKVSHGDFNVQVNTKYHKGEFGEVVRAFNKMTEELSHIEVFRNDFVNYFSHEFKTPIVSIRGFARQLESPNLTDEERHEYIQTIISECNRLTSLSSDILMLSRLENQEIVTDTTTFNLSEQIRHTLVVLEKDWESKNIELDIDLDEVDYTFNEEMLAIVWMNLLSNAIKFTNDNGSIKVHLRKEEKQILVVISDNGIGMDPSIVSHIFEKFYQGDTSHKTKGNGLGLSLVQRIISLCEGTISVDSKINEGSTFTISLPIK